jgi:hypothetical protein
LIFSTIDGKLLRAVTLPKSEGPSDLTTTNIVFSGIHDIDFYKAYLNVKHPTSTGSFIQTGYYIFAANFTIASLSTTNPSVMWSRTSHLIGKLDVPLGLIADLQG